MSDCVPMAEGPATASARYPYAEWLKIPDGMALEISDQLNGQPPRSCRQAIAAYFKYHDMPLVVLMRSERLFIVRKAEAPTKKRKR